MRTLLNSFSRQVDKRIRWLFVFSIVAFSFFITLVLVQERSQFIARTGLYAGYRAIKAVENTRALVLETESASRGFLVIGDSFYLQSLNRLHAQLTDSLANIPHLLIATPADSVSLLISTILQKIRYQRVFVQRNAKDRTGWIETGVASKKNTMIVRRLLLYSMLKEEAGIAEKIKISEDRTDIGAALAIYGGIFALLLVLAILLRLGRHMYLRGKTEEQLQESEQQYRTLIENAGVVIFTSDADGMITFTSRQAFELTGYTAEEIAGQHFSFLVDREWVDTVNAFYSNQLHNRIQFTTFEFPARRRDGQSVWVEQSVQLVTEEGNVTGFHCIVKDISDRKRFAAELDKSEHQRRENEFRLISIIENTTALIFIKDIDGRYLMVNKRFKELMGLTDEMVIGKTDFDFNSRELAEYYRRSDEIIRTTKSVIETEEVVETEDGQRNLLLLKFPLLDDKRNVIGISGIATDITERVQSRLQLEAALQEAREARVLQEQFLANMSHEIRTPMNGIQGMTSLLLESDLTSDQREFALMIRHSINNLTAIINDILDYSNLRAGKIMLDRITFNIHDPLDAIKIQFSNQVNSKGLSFQVTLDQDVPPLITGDPYRLKQVLVSLVDNAIKFTEKGEIDIHVSLDERHGDQAVLRFTITDTGPGISPERQHTIFDSFTKSNMDVSRSYGGAGLGLAISKGLVALQNGNITVQSDIGKGSVFSFCIPYKLPAGVTEEYENNDPGAALSGRRILVVEDNEVNQQLVRFVLQRVGCSVVIACNGREAVDLLSADNSFDLVIMDLQMPVMDGYEAAIHIRRHLLSPIPILALTATALKDEQEKCRLVGMNDFMLKPFDFKDLYTRLLHLLLNKEPAPPAQTIPMNASHQPYDLSMLQELDDNESILDVLSMFLDSTPAEVAALQDLCKTEQWEEIQRLSHKIKGAVAILQPPVLSKKLAAMEENGRGLRDKNLLDGQIAEIVILFNELVAALQHEVARLQALVNPAS